MSSGTPGDTSRTRQDLFESVSAVVSDTRVLAAFREVDRRAFLPIDVQAQAYFDEPLAIGHGQTASQPRMIAIMLDALRLTGTETALEIGTGSGYQTVLLSKLVRHVHSVEVIPSLATAAEKALGADGTSNVELHLAGDVLGWPEAAPYDAIIVSAAASRLPQSLLDQLAPGGRLVIPVGTHNLQNLIVAESRPEGLTISSRGACRFVSLIGVEM